MGIHYQSSRPIRNQEIVRENSGEKNQEKMPKTIYGRGQALPEGKKM